jgi:hypothetical protein
VIGVPAMAVLKPDAIKWKMAIQQRDLPIESVSSWLAARRSDTLAAPVSDSRAR